jgi:serine/threonine-protein kinase
MAKKDGGSREHKAVLVFGRTAVSMGLISADDLREVVSAQEKARALGKSTKIGRLMIDLGYLNEAQVKMVLEEVKKKTRSLKTIGGYELVSEIGRGSLGTVYKARQVSLDRLVALKLIPKGDISPEEGQRFVAEAQAAGRLNHENIVQAIDVGETDDHFFFAMELFESQNLLGILGGKKRLPEALVCEIALGVVRALEHASAHKMVHRDIKPENILMDSEGNLKISDLGLTRSAERDKAGQAVAGSVTGTPHYVSPEQIKALPDVDIRTDIYSLGATMYYLLTGRHAYEGEKPVLILKKHLQEKLVPPAVRYSGVSAEMNRIVVRAMQKNRQKRYQAPGKMKEDLVRLRNLGPQKAAEATGAKLPAGASRPAPAELRSRSSGPNIPVIAAIVGAVLVAVVLFFVFTSGNGEPSGGGGGADDRPVKADPDPDDGPGDSSLDALPGMDEFKAIQAWGRENPMAFDEVINRLEELRRRHPRTRIVSLCRDEINAWKMRRKEASVKALGEIRDRVEELSHLGRFGEAVAKARTFPPSLLTDSIKAQLDGLVDGIVRSARERATAHARAADKAVRSGDWPAAVKALEKIKAFGMPSLWKQYESRMEEYAESAVASKHLAIHADLLREIAEKGIAAGPAFLAARLAEESLDAAVRDLLREEQLNLDWAKGIASKLRARLAEYRGGKISLLLRSGGELSGRVGGVVGDAVEVKREKGPKETAPLSDIRATDVSLLLATSSPAHFFRLACYAWYVLRDAAAASAFLDLSDGTRREVRRLRRTVSGTVRKVVGEKILEAEKALAAGKPADALAAMAPVLHRYRGLPGASEDLARAAAIFERANASSGRPPLAELLIGGQAVWTGRDQLRVTYDFSHAGQTADFAVRGGFWTAAEGFLVQSRRYPGQAESGSSNKNPEQGQMEVVLPGQWRNCVVLMEMAFLHRQVQGVGINFLAQDDGRRCAFDMRGTSDDLQAALFFKAGAAEPFMRAFGPWEPLTVQPGTAFSKIVLQVVGGSFKVRIPPDVVEVKGSAASSHAAQGFQRFPFGRVGIRACSPAAVRKIEISGQPDPVWIARLKRLGESLTVLEQTGEALLLTGKLHEAWIVESGEIQPQDGALVFDGQPAVASLPGVVSLLGGRPYELTVDMVCGSGVFFVRLPFRKQSTVWLIRPEGASPPPGATPQTFPLSTPVKAPPDTPLRISWKVDSESVRLLVGGQEIATERRGRLLGAFQAGPKGFPLAVGCFGPGWTLKAVQVKMNPAG